MTETRSPLLPPKREVARGYVMAAALTVTIVGVTLDVERLSLFGGVVFGMAYPTRTLGKNILVWYGKLSFFFFLVGILPGLLLRSLIQQ